ncbi:MAG: 1-acyl-sn-glycerol-3-phosphate acyltransferase [Neptuniibacter sp.]
MTEQQDPYKEIRPYHDNEVADVLTNLLHSNEFLTAVTQYQFPNMASRFGWLLKPFVRIALAAKVGEVDCVHDFQMLVANYMKKMIARTTTRLTCSGIDQLDPDEPYLFISNHRDIAMDPAFVNWVRYQYGMDTVRIAIGDNLLQKPYISDIMRMNKSFIVNRSVNGREMMKALTQLSDYIDHSIQSGNSIWLAQREGRAKDGNDETDPALLKMLYMAHRKKRSFSEQAKRLNIVPVSISYEYDPCDYLKANELHAKATEGGYEKSQFEDIASIVKGITGDKGHVHIAFGDPIEGDFDSPEVLATEIDRQIIENYHLHPSNLLAAGQDENISEQDRHGLDARINQVSGGAQDILRQMYANPVLNQKKQQELS